MAGLKLSAELQLKIQDFTSKLASASGKMDTFTSKLSNSYKEANKELHKHSLGLKDTARIVQGIVVSQAFYTVAGSIRDATRALLDFNEKLDYAHVTYTALFGDASLASDFSRVLQEHSINTIFDYSSLEGSAKKMLAYGIEYENLMYVMEGLTNLGAMSGDTASLDRIALALGQIQTTGYLAATEMRQLANAYVPIYDIVQAGFGLTGDQMKNVGDLKLPAHQVINAIVDYANLKFASVGDAAMMTITGLKNRIIDTMKVLGSQMLMPLTTAWKSFLKYFSEGLEGLRAQYTARGWAGVFETLVPSKEAQVTIRAFVANVINLVKTLVSVLSSAMSILGVFGQAFVTAFNIVAPPVMFVVNVLAALLKAIAENAYAAAALRTAVIAAAGAFVVLRVQALAALVITAVKNAVDGLSKSLLILSSLITKHPILMMLAGLTVALVGISAASNNAGNSLKGLFNTFNTLGGTTAPGDIFKETANGANGADDALNQFNNRLEDSAGSAEDLGDAIGNAGKEASKAAKGLLSFDEVFKLSDKDSGSGDFAYNPDAIKNLIGELGALGGALIPEIPDFTEFINGFTDDLFGGLFEKIKSIASGGLTGALIGGLAGFAIGGLVTKTMAGALGGAKLGSALGGAAGAGFAAFWEESYAKMEETLQGIATGGAIGALVGGLTGLLIGAFATKTMVGAMTGARYGTAIGTLVGGALGGVFTGFEDELKKRIEQIAWGASYGALVGGLVGMLLGAFATKSLSGAMTGARYGTAIAAGIGGLIGGTLEGVFGDAEATLGDRLNNMFADVSAASYGAVIGGLVGMIIGAVVGAFAGGIGALPGAKLGATLGSAIGGLGAMVGSYLQTSGISENIAEWFNGIGQSIKDTWSTKWDEIKTSVSIKWQEIKDEASTAWDELKTDTAVNLVLIANDWNKKWNGIKASFTARLDELLRKNGTSLDEVKAKWSTKWNEIKTNMGTWWAGMKTSMGAWLENNIWQPIASFFNVSSFWNRISGMLNSIKNRISSWWDGVKSLFSGGIDIDLGASLSAGISTVRSSLAGHAAGGVFNREHVARFAEGNKAEAIIPLENASAMQPFVNAVSQGLIEGLAPALLQTRPGTDSGLPPMYVGTLVADERGLKQLYKKFEVIQTQENARRGLVT